MWREVRGGEGVERPGEKWREGKRGRKGVTYRGSKGEVERGGGKCKAVKVDGRGEKGRGGEGRVEGRADEGKGGGSEVEQITDGMAGEEWKRGGRAGVDEV